MPTLDAAIVQAATPQIPFWLQILTIALSPILGFIGVAVGAFLAEQNRPRLSQFSALRAGDIEAGSIGASASWRA